MTGLPPPWPALALLLLAGMAPGQEPPAANPAAARFRVWLWTHQEDRPSPERAAALEAHGIHGIQASPGDPPEEPHGLPVYLDQILSRPVFSIQERDWLDATPERRGPRPVCLKDPGVLAGESARLADILGPYRNAPPDFLCLRDEPSYSLLNAPADWCASPLCAEALRSWIENRWGPGRATESYGMKEGDEDWIEAGSTRRAREAFFHDPGNPRALVAWNDARIFADRTFTETLVRFAREARTLLPRTAAGYLGLAMPSAFGGIDYEELLPHLDIVEVYDYGAAHGIAMSLKAAHTRMLTTLFPGSETREETVHRLYEAFLRGDTDAVVYSSREIAGEDGGLSGGPLHHLAPHLLSVQSADWAPWLSATPVKPEIAILFNMADVRLHWIEDTLHDGNTWIRRLGSHQNRRETHALERQAWACLLHDTGLPFRYITPAQLESGILAREGIRVCILNRASALSPAAASVLRGFVKTGGLLIADSQPALYSETLRRQDIPSLDRLFGVVRNGIRSNFDGESIRKGAYKAGLPFPIAESHLRAVQAAPDLIFADQPVLISRKTSEGRTLYLNLILRDYLRLRIAEPERAAWLRSRIETAVAHAGPRPPVVFEHAPDSLRIPVRVAVRHSGAETFVAAWLNPRSGALRLEEERMPAGAAVQGTLRLPRSMGGVDLASGREVPRSIRPPVELALDRPVLLRLRP